MTLSTARARECLKHCELQKLFIEELGWDRHAASHSASVNGHEYHVAAVAQKRGVQIFQCSPDGDGRIPDYSVRRKIEKQVTKVAYEHLLIFADKEKSTQIWQWVARQPGQPAQCREHSYHPRTQSGDALIQKLSHIYFPLDDEEALDLTGAVHKLRDAFDRDRVTKKFYDRFKTEHAAFLTFIKGITAQADREWYASLMLNRLMFVYFIQRKGFLDGHVDYLRNRLERVQTREGRGRFLTFYRYFLLALFHEGFAKQEADRTLAADLAELLGNIPYLNGGLFDVHVLEEKYPKVDIPDEAFEKLFDFFDQYEWHLDTRPLRNDREINPDVLGYIFEKYINQKQMGAYYTKEDITEYISKNTIIPYLCDAAKKKCAVAFDMPPSPTGRGAGGEGVPALWRLLRDDPDRYIYPAVRHGVLAPDGKVLPLPPAVAKGIDDVAKRGGWNRPASDDYGLPTETWREHVARRQRCLELRKKLAAGEVHEVNDLVTYNLNIRQFAEDAITQCEGPGPLRGFLHAIRDVTVLDPACGSGAFLFAALSILHPLYEACLDRMQAFVEDLDRSGERHSPKKFEDFRAVLADIAQHPSRDYFILKSIIVHNLYGVDIMEEAVEICKLRLFLKLVAQVDRVEQLEPLPDVDFNIRPGNTLVGFVTLDEIRTSKEAVRRGKDSQKLMIDSDEDAEIREIEEEARFVDQAYRMFHDMQTRHGMKSGDFAQSKKALKQRLKQLVDILDPFLAGDYGVNVNKHPKKLQEWRSSHQPFHWLAEFFGIMSGGGFDVIIGNPPYVELKAVEGYSLINFACLSCGNLYALVLERCMRLIEKSGYQGFIVPVSSISTDRYVELQQRLCKQRLWYSSFDDRPSRLFDGLEHIRLTIHIIGPECPTTSLNSSRYNKWNAVERATLFDQLTLAESQPTLVSCTFPKLCSQFEHSILSSLVAQKHTLADYYASHGRHEIYYSRKVGYFLQVLNFEPRVLDGRGKRRPPSEFKSLCFGTAEHASAALCCLNSNLFYWFVTVFSDCRHVNKREVDAFPIDLNALTDSRIGKKLKKLGESLMNDLKSHSETRKMRFAHDELTVQCIIPKASKPLIDDIDMVLADHYGISDAERDFIINYDIKYRMGQDSDEDEE